MPDSHLRPITDRHCWSLTNHRPLLLVPVPPSCLLVLHFKLFFFGDLTYYKHVNIFLHGKCTVFWTCISSNNKTRRCGTLKRRGLAVVMSRLNKWILTIYSQDLQVTKIKHIKHILVCKPVLDYRHFGKLNFLLPVIFRK